MAQTYWIGFGWIVGLLVRSLQLPAWWLLPLAAVGMVVGRRDRRIATTWFVTGCIALLAWGYLGWRMPTPLPSDVSQQAPQSSATTIARIASVPKLRPSGRMQVWVEAETYSTPDLAERDISGKLYATFDAEAIPVALHPGQSVSLHGFLYRPNSAENPGSFSFRRFLAQQGCFAGMSVRELEVVNAETTWGGWVLRQRIRRGLLQGLGDRAGELLSALVLGASASQVPFELQASFRTAGLAHVMAASGFHVVVLMDISSRLTSWFSPRRRAASILACLAGYVILTGGSPSILRAALMGGAAVLAQSWSEIHHGGRQGIRLNPSGVLLVVVVLLLIWQPLWIDNIGFRLSATATLGLLVSAKPIEATLTWMPTNWARAIAVPLAASIWTLPLQLLTFGKVPTYSLLANCLALPLVIPLTVMGFVSCLLCAISPAVGALAAQLLYVPLVALANGVTWIASLPGAALHAGTVSFGQCVGLYLLLSLWVWRTSTIQPTLQLRWPVQSRRWAIGLVIGALVLSLLWPGPKISMLAFATLDAPVLAIRTRRAITLVNSGSADTVQYAVLPFLQSEGIRQVQHAIALTPDGRTNGGWDELIATIPVRQFWSGDRQTIASDYAEAVGALTTGNTVLSHPQAGDILWREGDMQLQVLQTEPMVLQLSVGNIRWLLLGSVSVPQQQKLLDSIFLTPPIDWLWWNGGDLSESLVNTLDIRSGLVSGQVMSTLSESFKSKSDSRQPVWQTRHLGALEWTLRGITLAQVEKEW